jgi:hypothetical protein
MPAKPLSSFARLDSRGRLSLHELCRGGALMLRLDFVYGLNVAVTNCCPAAVTEQVGVVPVHPPPDHPVKIEPVLGVAVSVTMLAAVAGTVHQLFVPQELLLTTNGGLLLTLPPPVPTPITLAVTRGGSFQLAAGV